METARRVLARHDAPALPYTELHRLVSSEITGPAPRRDQLLRRVRGRPDLFRTLDPRRGAWRALGEVAPGSDTYPWLEPWVLLARPSGRSGETCGKDGRTRRPEPRGVDVGAPRRGFPRVRESVLHLGRTLDAASPTTLSRWLFIAHEERTVRARLNRPSEAARSTTRRR